MAPRMARPGGRAISLASPYRGHPLTSTSNPLADPPVAEECALPAALRRAGDAARGGACSLDRLARERRDRALGLEHPREDAAVRVRALGRAEAALRRRLGPLPGKQRPVLVRRLGVGAAPRPAEIGRGGDDAGGAKEALAAAAVLALGEAGDILRRLERLGDRSHSRGEHGGARRHALESVAC